MAKRKLIALVLCTLFTWIWESVAVEQNAPLYQKETELKNFLLKNYDKSVPPNQDNRTTTEVQFGVGLVDVESLDEISGILTTHIWLRLAWKDERLKFDPSAYGGLRAVAIPYNLVWRPDIVPYNLAQGEFKYSTEYHVVVYDSGSALFVPHTRLQTRCALDFAKYPFDQQQCRMKFGSWVYSGNVMKLKEYDPGFDTREYHQNTEWLLVNTSFTINSKFYPCCSEEYQDFTANITLRRHGVLLANMYLGPSVAIGLVIPVIFLLPQESIYKLVMGGTLLISQVLVLAMLLQSLPISHNMVPSLARYELVNIILLLLSLVFSSVVIYCYQRAKKGGVGVPSVIDKIFLGVFGRLFCARREDFIESTDTGPKDLIVNESTNDASQNDDSEIMVKEYTRLVAPAEWRQLAVVLDRLFFACYTIFTVIIMASMVKYTY